MIAMLTIMVPFSVTTASAQTSRYAHNRTNTQRVYKKPSFYSRHRNLINLGIGAGAGTLIGALAGGKKGAALGALIGGGGAAVYTYGIKPKKKRVYYARRYR
jgi:outer membrane lipoprotein SlyB